MRSFATILFLLPAATASAGVVCRGGSVMPTVIHKAAAGLPMSMRVPMNLGSRLPYGVQTAPLPTVLGQILPQYPGYRAVRTPKTVAIIDPRSRRIAYLLPLDLKTPFDCPDS